MSDAEYESLMETLALLSTAGFKEAFEQAQGEAKAKDTRSFDEVFSEPQ